MQSQRLSTLFLCLIVATLVSTALSTSVVRKCYPGKTYFNGCNNCHCSADGDELCEMKFCTVYDENLKQEVPMQERQAPDGFWAPINVIEPPRASDFPATHNA